MRRTDMTKDHDSQHDSNASPFVGVFAVIDIGATSVRMMIAQVIADGTIDTLENLSQAVSLGKDSFIKGFIEKATIEDCVKVLQVYRHKLINEYGIDESRIRVVATSAVREARNRQAFQDRVFIATGFEIQPFDEAELHRVTYLGALPFLGLSGTSDDEQTVICEVGGGSTELIVLKFDRVAFARTYRLGSLRLQKTMETHHLALSEIRNLMESQINQTVSQIRTVMNLDNPIRLIVMGSDMRLATKKISGHDPREQLVPIDVADLKKFTNKILAEKPERLIRAYSLSLPEAESLGPALLANLLIARGLNANQVLVANANIRNGLIKEMAFGSLWTHAVETQILQSAFNIGRKFQVDETHARHVANLATSIFRQIGGLHQIEPRNELLLHLAALLHEVGLFVGYRSHHKHAYYIIRNADLFGLGSDDVELVALISRYHRRAFPQSRHDAYARLKRRDRVTVSKMAALLRVAKSLDNSRQQRIQDVHCELKPGQLVLHVASSSDLTMEEIELPTQAKFFYELFGFQIHLPTSARTEK